MNIEGLTIKILKRDEILRESDIVRLIVETGDEGGFSISYKPDGWHPLRWHKVSEEMPGCIGCKISEYKYNGFYEYARIQ